MLLNGKFLVRENLKIIRKSYVIKVEQILAYA